MTPSPSSVGKGRLTEQDKVFNLGTAMWKGKMLTDMTSEELYKAFHDLGMLYNRELEENLNPVIKLR